MSIRQTNSNQVSSLKGGLFGAVCRVACTALVEQHEDPFGPAVLQHADHFAENKPQRLCWPVFIREVNLQKNLLPLAPRGMFLLRGSLSGARVKRVVAVLNGNSLDTAKRQARVLLGRGMFSQRYRKLQIKQPPVCRKPSEFQAFMC